MRWAAVATKCWNSRSVSPQFTGEVHLPGDLDKAACRIQVVANLVVGHGFYHGVGQPFSLEIIQRMFDELPANTAAPRLRNDGQIWDSALACVSFQAGGDISQNPAGLFRDKNSSRVGRDVFINMPGFAPAPVVAMQNAQALFHALIEGEAIEGFDRHPFEFREITGLVQS